MNPRGPGSGAGVRAEGFARDDRRVVRAAIRGALRAMRADRIGVDVRAVDERESLRLNRTYRGRPWPGDVLSFPLPADGPGESAGDLYFCLPLIERGARRHGLARRRWLGWLAVHGLLHLLGFDHRTPAEARRMDGLTRALRAGGARR